MTSVGIEEALRTMALKNIKRFYIEHLINSYNIEISVAATMLYEFSQRSDRLKLKYELRCSNCINIMSEFDNIFDIKKDTEIECEDCGFSNIIDSNNIYIVYYISKEYREEIQNLSKQLKSSRRDRNRNKNKISAPSSVQVLEKMNAFKVSTNDNAYQLHYHYHAHQGAQYINNGQTASMGDHAFASEFEME